MDQLARPGRPAPLRAVRDGVDSSTGVEAHNAHRLFDEHWNSTAIRPVLGKDSPRTGCLSTALHGVNGPPAEMLVQRTNAARASHPRIMRSTVVAEERERWKDRRASRPRPALCRRSAEARPVLITPRPSTGLVPK